MVEKQQTRAQGIIPEIMKTVSKHRRKPRWNWQNILRYFKDKSKPHTHYNVLGWNMYYHIFILTTTTPHTSRI